MMTTGYLYYGDPKLSLEKRVVGAVEYHVKKVGVIPDLCLVHSKDFGEGEFIVTTRPYSGIPKGHLWVGVDNASNR